MTNIDAHTSATNRHKIKKDHHKKLSEVYLLGEIFIFKTSLLHFTSKFFKPHPVHFVFLELFRGKIHLWPKISLTSFRRMLCQCPCSVSGTGTETESQGCWMGSLRESLPPHCSGCGTPPLQQNNKERHNEQ